MNCRFSAVEMFDKRNNAPLIEQLVFFLASLILDGDCRPSIQGRQLAQSLGENVEAELGSFKDRSVGLKGDPGPALLGYADFFQTALRLAPLVALLIDFAVPLDFYFQGFRQSINDRNSHAMKATGNLVRSFIELAARVELREHDFGGGDFLRLVNIHRNTTAIVDYGNAVIDVNRYINLVAVAGQS